MLRSVADHQVVDTPVRNETKLVEQVAQFGQPFLAFRNQQRIVGCGQFVEVLVRKWPVTQLPGTGAILFDHQAAMHVFLAGKPGKFFRAYRRFEVGERVAQDAGFFLPVLADELRAVESL